MLGCPCKKPFLAPDNLFLGRGSDRWGRAACPVPTKWSPVTPRRVIETVAVVDGLDQLRAVLVQTALKRQEGAQVRGHLPASEPTQPRDEQTLSPLPPNHISTTACPPDSVLLPLAFPPAGSGYGGKWPRETLSEGQGESE